MVAFHPRAHSLRHARSWMYGAATLRPAPLVAPVSETPPPVSETPPPRSLTLPPVSETPPPVSETPPPETRGPAD